MTMRIERSLRRGITLRRLTRVVKEPAVLIRNFRFHIVRTTSSEKHVFVLGPPRSGTTLMQALIGAHPDFGGFPDETRFFFHRNMYSIRCPGISQRRIREIIDGSRDVVDIFDGVAEEFRSRFHVKWFVEKTPEHAFRLRFLRKRFPESKFVFLYRDGRDALASAQRVPKLKMKSPEAYAHTWKRCVTARVREGEAENVIDVQYEDLVSSPVQVLKRVMEFLGAEMVGQQLDPEVYSETPVSSQSGHERLNEVITPRSVGQWKQQLTSEEISTFEAIVGTQMKLFGYELSSHREG